MSTTLMAALCTIAFTFDDAGIHWIWTNNKPVAVVLAILTVVLGVLWIKSSDRWNSAA